MRCVVGLLALGIATGGGLHAQTVRGQLTDSVTKTPLPGAFLTLIDAAGAERARAMTDAAGNFVIVAPGGGSYHLRSKRIGFRPFVSPLLALKDGETTAYDVNIDPIPIELAKVVVAGEQQCDVDAGASVAALWQEVHEALAAVTWTARTPAYWYEIAHFERDLLIERKFPVRDSSWRETGYQRVPFVSTSADSLALLGFVVVGEDGWTYFAPDASVLLSDPFLRTHCFETRIGSDDNEGLVGLGFAPARDRRVPDISGTLWVNKQTAELDHLDFTYTKLPERLIEPRAGGRMEFMRVPSGAWIVREWVIRMPRARQVRAPVSQDTWYQVYGFRETGGSTLQITTARGVTVYSADPAVVAAAAPTPEPPAEPVQPAQPVQLAETPPPAPPPPLPSTPQAPRARGRSGDTLKEEEFRTSTAMDAYGLVLQYRPNWLHSRGPISLRDPTAGVVKIYLDGTPFGDVTRLHDIIAGDVREMRFLSGPDATTRYGTGNGGGAIEVRTH